MCTLLPSGRSRYNLARIGLRCGCGFLKMIANVWSGIFCTSFKLAAQSRADWESVRVLNSYAALSTGWPSNHCLAILNRRILFNRVVLLSPRRSAAPPLPAILPDASLKASMITCRSACRNVDDGDMTVLKDFFRCVHGTFNSSPCVRITQRSIKFSSSRMFPGQSALTRASIAIFWIDRMHFCMRRERRDTKKWTSNGMSSRRSRRGGISIGNTLKR